MGTTEELIADLARQVGRLETEKSGAFAGVSSGEIFAVARDLRTWVRESYSSSAREALTPLIERLEKVAGVTAPEAVTQAEAELPQPAPAPDVL